MTAARLSFLPWVRQGAAAGLRNADPLGAPLPARVALQAELAVNDQPLATRAVQLFGPGDVLGIDPRQIVRMDPPPGSTGFEPNYLVAIEFDRPDFPWLFTPAAPGGDGKLRPWLVLAVVQQQPGVALLPAGDGPLPVLQISAPAKPADELPDLAESPFWAHAQAAGAEDLATTLAARPEASLSRLLCPRLLQPDTDYIACLVPAFDAGRLAGLGEAVDVDTLGPAWSLAQPQLRLPLYHHWHFRTGSGGDFESLVGLLQPQPAPPGLGRRDVAIGQPGFALPAEVPQGTLHAFGGALLPAGAPLPAWPQTERAAFQSALAAIVNEPGEAQAASPDDDPLLAPPLYGRWHAARATVQPGTPRDWLDELNLDPDHRAAAAIGTRVVQEHQESLMASAWAQAGELQRANQLLRQMQLALVAGRSLHQRHFTRLSDEALLRVGAPAFARVVLPGARGAAPATLSAQLGGTALPVRAASPALRRLAAARGPLNRRLAVMGAVRPGALNFVSQLASGAGAEFVRPPVPDVVTVGVVRQRLAQPALVRGFAQVNAQSLAAVAGRHAFTPMPEGRPVPLPPPIRIRLPDNAAATAFRAAATAHLQGIDAGRLGLSIFVRPTVPLDTLRGGLLEATAPQAQVAALARARVRLGDAPRRAAAPGALPVEPLMFAPRFEQPMFEPLRELSQELLLPGLQAIAPNSVIGLQTNRRFVEAYLVGLNVEMAHELLWRGFPTDQRGSSFLRFWDTRGGAASRADIEPIHAWGARTLGSADGAPARERFVLLLRSELLRRYPSAVIYAVPALPVGPSRRPSADPAQELHPAFRGSLEPDISFFGFDLDVAQMVGDGVHRGHYLVIQEQPSEPRFGFDVGTFGVAQRQVRIADGAPAGHDLQGLQWGRNAAHMAGITRQMPVRIAIHASKLV